MHLAQTSASRGVASLTCRPHVRSVIPYGHIRGKGYPQRWSRPRYRSHYRFYSTSPSIDLSHFNVTSSTVAAATARIARAPSVALIAFAPFVAIAVRALFVVLLSYELLLRRSRRCFFSPRRRFVIISSHHREGYEPVQIQRKKRILKQRLKVPPALNQFTKTLDKNLGAQEVLFLDNEIAFNEAITEEREQDIQEIQQQIGEMLGVGAVLPCSSSSSSELNPAIRSEVSFSVGSCLLPHPDKFSADISSKLGSSFSIVPFVIVVSVCTILTMIATLPVAQLFFFHILFVEKLLRESALMKNMAVGFLTYSHLNVPSCIVYDEGNDERNLQLPLCKQKAALPDTRGSTNDMALILEPAIRKVEKKALLIVPFSLKLVTRDGPSLKVQLCVLKGDFESEDWTIEEFNSNIESPRERKGSLLKGDTAIIFKNVSYCKGSSGVDSQWCSSMNTLKFMF
ncbi:putative protein S-acyltransferase [Arachis hypogaea]|nr:putative protein S-acyltransferase [Arachis hypogaea]